MSNLSLLSACEDSPSELQTLRQDTISAEESKGLPFASELKSAVWLKQGTVADRRTNIRRSVDFSVQLIPLNERLQPIGPVYPGRVLDYSCDGVCLEHQQVLPEPYIEIHWHDAHQQKQTATVRLKWCRSVSKNTFRSGGRLVGFH